jgi:hypothetical protein
MTILMRGSPVTLFVACRDAEAVESPTAIINLPRSARAVRLPSQAPTIATLFASASRRGYAIAAQAPILCFLVALQQIYDSSKFSLLVDGSEAGEGGTQLVMQLRAETDEERHAQMWVQAFGSEWATDDDDEQHGNAS